MYRHKTIAKGHVRNRCLGSFTLIELIVVLIITGIFSWLAYAIFLNVNGYYRSIDQRITQKTTLQRYKHTLAYDVYSSDSLMLAHDTLLIYQDSLEVKYFMQDSFMTRQALSQSYVFEIQVLGVEVDFENKAVISRLIDDTLSFSTAMTPWVILRK